MITTQDLVAGIDILGLPTVSGSELMQLVNSGRLAEDKGFIIETQDTALDTPETPDPGHDYAGVVPVWFKRYIWRRKHFNDNSILTYVWSEASVFDPTLLYWTLIDLEGKNALTLANDAQTSADAAQATANTALSNANIAQINVDHAQAGVDANLAAINLFQVTLQELEANLLTFWSAGDLKHTCKTTIYSTIVNNGWLECNGDAVDRIIFADLFLAIGTTFGAGDAVTTFNIPDFRGRTLIGKGTGAGLTARNLGLTNGGEENHTLTGLESGIAAHKHTVSSKGNGGGELIVSATNVGTGAPLVQDTSITGPVDAASSHNNMMPFAVSRILIKT